MTRRNNLTHIRGCITQEITDHKLGAGINREAVSLIAYMHDSCHNMNRLDKNRLNRVDRKILRCWYLKDYIKLSEEEFFVDFLITEEFYDFMCLVMKSSYARPSCIIEPKAEE